MTPRNNRYDLRGVLKTESNRQNYMTSAHPQVTHADPPFDYDALRQLDLGITEKDQETLF